MSEYKDVVSLKEHLEVRITALEKATQVAKTEMDRRLEGMNEFRSQLDKQTRTFVDKEYFNHCNESLDRRIKDLEVHKGKMEGKADQSSLQTTTVLAIAALALSTFGLIVRLLM